MLNFLNKIKILLILVIIFMNFLLFSSKDAIFFDNNATSLSSISSSIFFISIFLYSFCPSFSYSFLYLPIKKFSLVFLKIITEFLQIYIICCLFASDLSKIESNNFFISA